MRYSFTLLFQLSSHFILAKQDSFAYQETREGFLLTNEIDSLKYNSQNAAMTRKVIVNDGNYSFESKKNSNGKVLEVYDQSGQSQATVLRNGNKKNDIVKLAGDRCFWKKINRQSWSYTFGNGEVLRGTSQKMKGRKFSEFNIVNGSIREFISLMDFDRAEDFISKVNLVPIIFCSILVAITGQSSSK